jgi:small subunit ribosomal protein S16
MAVKIRLARYGAKKKPFYRVVAAESIFPRDGRFIDVLGTYDPRDKEKGLKLNVEGIRSWVARGAQVSDTVRRIMKQAERSAPAKE